MPATWCGQEMSLLCSLSCVLSIKLYHSDFISRTFFGMFFGTSLYRNAKGIIFVLILGSTNGLAGLKSSQPLTECCFSRLVKCCNATHFYSMKSFQLPAFHNSQLLSMQNKGTSYLWSSMVLFPVLPWSVTDLLFPWSGLDMRWKYTLNGKLVYHRTSWTQHSHGCAYQGAIMI